MYWFIRWAIGLVAIAAIMSTGCGNSTSAKHTTRTIVLPKKPSSSLLKSSSGVLKGWKSRQPIRPGE